MTSVRTARRILEKENAGRKLSQQVVRAIRQYANQGLTGEQIAAQIRAKPDNLPVLVTGVGPLHLLNH